jgi:tetratricopeptide (TPR) repeat protein
MRTPIAALATAIALTATPAAAQTYVRATPPPRTTDAAVLAAQAHAREVHERFTRGLAAEGRADWDAAATEFRRIVVLDPPEPAGSSARYDLALAEANAGRDAEAVHLLEDALHRDPGFAAAAANLVAIQLRRGDLAGARIAADRFVALAPAAALARYDRGLAALRTGDLATARADFQVLLAADPGYAVAHYDLAVIEARAGHDDAALAELERALTLAPDYARARFAEGTVLLRGGRRNDARLAFDRCAHDASDPTLRALAIDLRDRLAAP